MPVDIPTVIMEMVASSHGYTMCRPSSEDDYRTKVIARLNQPFKGPVVSETVTKADMPYIARFLNASVYWSNKDVLLQHWQFTKQCIQARNGFEVSQVELPSMFNRDVVHPVLCYAYCHRNHIPLQADTTVEDMKRYITLHQYSTDALYALTRMVLGTPPTSTLMHGLVTRIVDSLPYVWSDRPISSSTVQGAIKLKNSLDVKSYRSAIVVAALTYDINISRCRNPMLALIALAHKRVTTPSDALSGAMPVSEEWQPNMVIIYDHMRNAARRPVKRTTGFFHGYIGRTYNRELFITDEDLEIEQHSPDDIVCYVTDSVTIPITYRALVRMFQVQYNYHIAGAPTPTNEHMEQLLVMANSRQQHDLVRAIELVAAMNDVSQRPYGEACIVYQNCSTIDKLRIKDAIRAIMAAAMAMRGWDGSDDSIDYKLSNLTNHRTPEETDRTVSAMISRLHHCVALVPQCDIMSLTMLQPDSKKAITKMVPVLYNGESINLATKLAIMSGVLPGNVVDTCIRIASNQLLAVYYQASVTILGESPFELSSVKFTAS